MTKILFIILALSTFCAAQSVYTPEKGSAERTAILNVIRVPVERDMKQKVVFVTEHFNVLGSWAFVGGYPQTPDGGEPDYSKTKFRVAVEDGTFDNNFFALVRKKAGRWRVVTYRIGCTDVCYSDWWSTHRAPKALFPYTE